MPELEIIYEDNHLLVVNKPAGIATMGALRGQPTLHAMASEYLKKKYNKPGQAYVGVVSRLDAMTSGVLVLARTSKAASRLAAQFAAKAEPSSPSVAKSTVAKSGATKSSATKSSVTKIYLAALQGHLEPDRGELTDFVLKDDQAHRMRVVQDARQGAQLAALRYLTVASHDDWTIVAVELLSGRKHQIRVQFADRGHAVIGDRKYKSTRPMPDGIALHSWRLRIHHPTRRDAMWFEAELPRSWRSFRSFLPPADQLKQRVDQFLQSCHDREQS